MSTFAAVVVEAVKDGLRQTQNGQWKLTIALHPSDDMGWLLNAPMGQRLGLTIAALHDRIAESSPQGQPSTGDAVSPTVSSANSKPKRKWDELKLSEQAGIRCADPEFQQYIKRGWRRQWDDAFRLDDATTTAAVVRWYCAVGSRADLDKDKHGAKAWLLLNDGFLSDAGRIPEAR